jgi:hypothetical protein
MNVFVPDNAKVRVFVDKRGFSVIATNNIIPNLKVEVVVVPDGQSIVRAEEALEGSLPFESYVTPLP